MDNNNFNGGMNNPQNMSPNMQPNMQMGQMGLNMGQPYPQQMMRPPKQPMDPVKKKRIIMIVSIISALAVMGIVLAIVLPMVFRVDYSTAYNTVKELQPKIYDIYQSYDCEYVVDYVDSDYTSVKSYNEYINGCAEVFSAETSNLVNDLGNTDGVKRNEEIKLQFEKFKSVYDSMSPNYDELMTKLAAYKARHEFVVAVEDLSYSSSDAEITAAANKLIESGNDTLKTYGEGWLEKYLTAAHAYQDWRNSPGYFGEKYDIKNNADTERKDWISANKPDVKSLYPLNMDDTSKLYSEFDKLYDLISETYALNYNSGSGDCTEFLGEVYCE